MNKHCSIFEEAACGTGAAFSCSQTWDGAEDRKLSPSFTPRRLKTENKQAVKNKGALEGARGVKLQQQLVYPGMAARMLTLPFTSHLLPYHQQSLVHIPSRFLLSLYCICTCLFKSIMIIFLASLGADAPLHVSQQSPHEQDTVPQRRTEAAVRAACVSATVSSIYILNENNSQLPLMLKQHHQAY